MKLKDYKVNYKDYQYIDEPMIYVWEELLNLNISVMLW